MATSDEAERQYLERRNRGVDRGRAMTLADCDECGERFDTRDSAECPTCGERWADEPDRDAPTELPPESSDSD